uniref:hypothetical protein n=1 Tax=Eisenbergiella sp. TaxID=1924109 RepID=UPI003AB4866D
HPIRNEIPSPEKPGYPARLFTLWQVCKNVTFIEVFLLLFVLCNCGNSYTIDGREVFFDQIRKRI